MLTKSLHEANKLKTPVKKTVASSIIVLIGLFGIFLFFQKTWFFQYPHVYHLKNVSNKGVELTDEDFLAFQEVENAVQHRKEFQKTFVLLVRVLDSPKGQDVDLFVTDSSGAHEDGDAYLDYSWNKKTKKLSEAAWDF